MVFCDYASQVVHYHHQGYYAKRIGIPVYLEGNLDIVSDDGFFHDSSRKKIQDQT
jgi:hypothetical protein